MEPRRRFRLPSFTEGFGAVAFADDHPPPYPALDFGPYDNTYSPPSFVHLQLPAPAPSPSPQLSSPSNVERSRKRSFSASSSSSSQTSSPFSLSQSCLDTPPAKRPRSSHVTSAPRSQRGFIILRPNAQGGSLRVAATSAHSFSDALDALRHRSAPEESETVDGDCFAPAAQRTMFECPFGTCGRKYTFMSNLRRHMRKSHDHH
ncbi:hypothetical protein AURDEDRAFT_184928 [Auricularia subglabra TFB-10046 SS5]|nr:hypothetical protein AURDEDRAFT_184928 [Auricularia subglabra TFB-10046 SS5]